jgi:hypothetical protein
MDSKILFLEKKYFCGNFFMSDLPAHNYGFILLKVYFILSCCGWIYLMIINILTKKYIAIILLHSEQF